MPATGGLLRLYPLSAKNVSIPSPALFAPILPPKRRLCLCNEGSYPHRQPLLKKNNVGEVFREIASLGNRRFCRDVIRLFITRFSPCKPSPSRQFSPALPVEKMPHFALNTPIHFDRISRAVSMGCAHIHSL